MTAPDSSRVGPFTAEVDREDGWWTIYVLELDVVTQAARWSEVEHMARGVVVAVLDLDEDAVVELELVPVFDDEPGRLLQQAEDLEARAQDLVTSAGEAKRAAIQALKSGGWTLQGIAAGLGLSYQRIEQILKSVPGEAGASKPTPARAGVPHQRDDLTVEVRTSSSSKSLDRTAGSATSGTSRAAARHSAAARTSRTTSRSVLSGRYVTKSTAHRHPGTTGDARRRSG